MRLDSGSIRASWYPQLLTFVPLFRNTLISWFERLPPELWALVMSRLRAPDEFAGYILSFLCFDSTTALRCESSSALPAALTIGCIRFISPTIRKIKIHAIEVDDDVLAALAQSTCAPFLELLHIGSEHGDRPQITDDSSHYWAKFRSLRSLKLTAPVAREMTIQALSRLTELRKLQLYLDWDTTTYGRVFASLLTGDGLPSLQRLSIDAVGDGDRHETGRSLIETLRSRTNSSNLLLRDISLDGSQAVLSVEEARHINKLCPNLNILSVLPGVHLGNELFEEFCPKSGVKTADIRTLMSSDAGALDPSKISSLLPTIKKLLLLPRGGGNVYLQDLNCQGFSCLTVLEFSIDWAPPIHLPATLRKLSWRFRNPSGQTASAIAALYDALPVQTPALEELRISVPVVPEAFRIKKLSNSLPFLKSLTLRHAPWPAVPADQIEEFVFSHPRLESAPEIVCANLEVKLGCFPALIAVSLTPADVAGDNLNFVAASLLHRFPNASSFSFGSLHPYQSAPIPEILACYGERVKSLQMDLRNDRPALVSILAKFEFLQSLTIASSPIISDDIPSILGALPLLQTLDVAAEPPGRLSSCLELLHHPLLASLSIKDGNFKPFLDVFAEFPANLVLAPCQRLSGARLPNLRSVSVASDRVNLSIEDFSCLLVVYIAKAKSGAALTFRNCPSLGYLSVSECLLLQLADTLSAAQYSSRLRTVFFRNTNFSSLLEEATSSAATPQDGPRFAIATNESLRVSAEGCSAAVKNLAERYPSLSANISDY